MRWRDTSRLTAVAKDEVEDIQVLAAEDIPMLPLAVRIAVRDGGHCQGEHDHIQPGG